MCCGAGLCERQRVAWVGIAEHCGAGVIWASEKGDAVVVSAISGRLRTFRTMVQFWTSRRVCRHFIDGPKKDRPGIQL